MDHDNDATMTDMVPEIFTRVFAIMRAVQREMARRYFDEIDCNRGQLKELLGQNDVGADN